MCRQDCDTKCTGCEIRTSSSSVPNIGTKTALGLFEEINFLQYFSIDVSNAARRKWTFKRFYGQCRCGLYSGMPICCVIFFVSIWINLFYLWNFKPIRDFCRWYPPGRFGYVPCPICFLRGNKKKIRNCFNHYDNPLPGCCLYKK